MINQIGMRVKDWKYPDVNVYRQKISIIPHRGKYHIVGKNQLAIPNTLRNESFKVQHPLTN